MPKFRPSRVHVKAFTLIEMLVVLAIALILGALALPAFQGSSRAYELDATGQLLVSQLSQARQNSLTSNHLVQVRLYQLPDYNQSPNGTITVYRGIQCFSEGDPAANGTVTLTALSKPIFFPAPVIISSSSSVSPLLPTAASSPTSTDPSLPLYQNNYRYTSFHFKPDGSTDLTSSNKALSLVLENDKPGTSGLPANYQTLQIDPVIGTIRRFLP